MGHSVTIKLYTLLSSFINDYLAQILMQKRSDYRKLFSLSEALIIKNNHACVCVMCM